MRKATGRILDRAEAFPVTVPEGPAAVPRRPPPEAGSVFCAPGGPPRPMALKDNLQAELKALEKELKIELPREIKRAVAMGDLRENAEYQTALERQRYLQSRIGHIKQKLSELSLMRPDQIPRDRIGLGSLFKVIDVDDDRQVEFEIVMDGMADPERGRISISSPLARGFVNRRVGDEVTINVPAGKRTYEILQIKTVHERG